MAEQFSISYLLKLNDQLTTPLLKLGQGLDDLDKKFTQSSGGALRMGKSMAAWATLPILGWTTYARHEAGKVEEAFRDMGHSLEGMPMANVDALKSKLIGMTAEVPRSVEELAEYAEMAGRMNELGDVPGFVKFMTKFTAVNKEMSGRQGISNFMDMVRSLRIVQAEYEHTGDIISVLAQRMNTSGQAIIQNSMDLSHLKMTTQIANDELMALSAWSDSFGSSGGMAMKQFTKTMAEAAQGMNMLNLSIMSKISGFGSDTGAFQREFEKSPAAIMQKFLKGLGQMKAEGQTYEMQRAMNQLGLSGNRVMGMVLRGAASADELGRALSLVSDRTKVNGKMTEDASAIYKTFGSQVSMLTNTINKFALQFGTDIKPVFTGLINMTKSVINVFTALPAPVRYSVEALLGIVAAAGPVLIALAAIKGSLAVLGITAATAFAAVVLPITAATAFAAVVLPITLAVIAFTSLATAIYEVHKNWQTLTATGFVDTLKDFGKFLGYVAMGGDFNKNNTLDSSRVLGTWDAKKNAYVYAPDVKLGDTTSGAGNQTSRGETVVRFELPSGIRVGEVRNGPGVRTDVNTEGYLGLRHAY